MKTLHSFVLSLCLTISAVYPQSVPIASFSITPEQDIPPQPVSVDISGLDYSEGDLLAVYSVGRKEKLPSQLLAASSPRLSFNPGQVLKAGDRYDFEIYRENAPEAADRILIRKDRDHITVSAGEQEVLKYRHSMTEASG